jgi:hypothetical protein
MTNYASVLVTLSGVVRQSTGSEPSYGEQVYLRCLGYKSLQVDTELFDMC